MECVDDRSLLIADHPHFLEIDAKRRQIFRNVADVLVLGAAGQDLAADHQECGRDNLFGSGRVGGWHDHQRVFNGQTPEVRPSDQRQVAGAFFQPPFKTYQRPRLAPWSGGSRKFSSTRAPGRPPPPVETYRADAVLTAAPPTSQHRAQRGSGEPSAIMRLAGLVRRPVLRLLERGDRIRLVPAETGRPARFQRFGRVGLYQRARMIAWDVGWVAMTS